MPRAQRFTADEELRQKRREQDARKMANNRANPPAQTEEATREANRTRQRDYRARVRARREQDKEERMDDAMERIFKQNRLEAFMQQLVQDRQDEHAGDGDQDGPNKHQSDEMDNFARYMMEMDDSEEEFLRETSGAQLRTNQASLRRNLGVSDNWTMIEPISDIVYSTPNGRFRVRRTQFPVLPAESMTIHKSQGQTMESVLVIDGLSANRITRQHLYVGCSRATSSSGLTLYCKDDTFLPRNPLADNSPLAVELQRQNGLMYSPKFTSMSTIDQSENLNIISHNIQSLRAHANQVVSDPFYLSASILLFSETWTVHNSVETFDIPGFQMVIKADNVNSNTPSAIGACCYIKESLMQSGPVHTDSIFLAERGCSVSVAVASLSRSVYASVYVSPNTSTSLIMQALRFIVNRPHISIVIGGDFNVDFGNNSRHPEKKRQILTFIAENGMHSPLNLSFTTKNGTFIDNIFSTVPVVNSGSYISFTSLHEPLYITIPQAPL